MQGEDALNTLREELAAEDYRTNEERESDIAAHQSTMPLRALEDAQILVGTVMRMLEDLLEEDAMLSGRVRGVVKDTLGEIDELYSVVRHERMDMMKKLTNE